MIRTLEAGLRVHCNACKLLSTTWQPTSQNQHSRTGLRFYCHTTTAVYRGKTHYDILGVDKDANETDIKKAFVKLSKEVHPDKNPNDPLTHEKFVKVYEAYKVLSKPISRREYDMSIAHKFYTQQNIARAGYGMHTPGMSSAPGSSYTGEYDGRQERVFWDETIWEMRDKSHDSKRFYPDDQYYGVKGVRKLPNHYILGFCGVLVLFGVLLHFLAYKIALKVHIEPLEKKHQENLRIYNEIRDRAKKLGTEKQIEIMRAKWEAKEAERKKKQLELLNNEK